MLRIANKCLYEHREAYVLLSCYSCLFNQFTHFSWLAVLKRNDWTGCLRRANVGQECQRLEEWDRRRQLETERKRKVGFFFHTLAQAHSNSAFLPLLSLFSVQSASSAQLSSEKENDTYDRIRLLRERSDTHIHTHTSLNFSYDSPNRTFLCPVSFLLEKPKEWKLEKAKKRRASSYQVYYI